MGFGVTSVPGGVLIAHDGPPGVRERVGDRSIDFIRECPSTLPVPLGWTSAGRPDQSKEKNVKMRWLIVVGLASLSVSALAENDTALLAKNVLIGSVSTDAVGPTAPADQNWFRYQVKAGRSYCAEVDNGEAETSIRDTDPDRVPHGRDDDRGDERRHHGRAGGVGVVALLLYRDGGRGQPGQGDGGGANVAGSFRIRIIDTTCSARGSSRGAGSRRSSW